MNYVKAFRAFGRFWYDFVIGDDWKIAAAVATALALLGVATADGWFGDAALAVMGGSLVVVAFVVALAIDVRARKR